MLPLCEPIYGALPGPLPYLHQAHGGLLTCLLSVWVPSPQGHSMDRIFQGISV